MGLHGSQVYRLNCEYSKSGRAACGRCSEKIGKGEVRVGRPIKWGGGANGFISTWQRMTQTPTISFLPR